jgi:hypothetical protein
MQPRIFRTRDAARYLGLAESTLEKRRIFGGGPRWVRLGSKYPPAEPGALGCEPLEAAVGVADAAPGYCEPPKGGSSAPKVHLLQALVFLFLFLDVVPYHLCVPSDCGYEVSPRPEVLTYEVPLLLTVYTS